MINDVFVKLLAEVLNPWILFGFISQFVFLMRFVVQWYISEKYKKSIIPDSFWYLSVAGTVMILIYSIEQRDIVFTTSSILQLVIYLRNIALLRKKQPESLKSPALQ